MGKQKLIISSFLIILIMSCGDATNSAADETLGFESYGAQINETGVEKASNIFVTVVDSLSVKLEGNIAQTCKMKGCWMNVKVGEEQIRVTFRDYGFFVPKEGVEGRKAIFEGTLKRSVTDVETLRHLAEDAGKSDAEIANIMEPKEELTFVADGVLIYEGED